MHNSRTLTVEKAIHVRFNDNKLDTTLLELDESYVEMKMENFLKFVTMSNQDKLASNTPMGDQFEEATEPTERLPRKHYSKSQNNGDPMDKVQRRNSLKHTTLQSKNEPKHIDNVMSHQYRAKAM